jgi:RsiW-degrading membrane proteinase PrsW (M82 family)
MDIILIATAPVFIILFYIYYRDKYEHEPIALLIKGLLAGCLAIIPVMFFEYWMQYLGSQFTGLNSAAWNAFMVAALVEEVFKFAAVYFLIWRNPNFNEEFDGIVYAVFVSLGFALVENMMYVFDKDAGFQVGLMRAFTAVPAHAMFGVMMGYRLGLAKFIPRKRAHYLLMAFLVPFFFHGVYDFILMSQKPLLILLFIPFVMYLLWRSIIRMRELVRNSFFKPENDPE